MGLWQPQHARPDNGHSRRPPNYRRVPVSDQHPTKILNAFNATIRSQPQPAQRKPSQRRLFKKFHNPLRRFLVVLLDQCPMRLEHVQGYYYNLLTPQSCSSLNSTLASRDNFHRVYEFVLSHVGQDKDGGRNLVGLHPIQISEVTPNLSLPFRSPNPSLTHWQLQHRKTGRPLQSVSPRHPNPARQRRDLER